MRTIHPITVRHYRSPWGERRRVYYETQYRNDRLGNGKDAELFLEFGEDKGMSVGVHDLSVTPHGDVQIHTVPCGDMALLIRYAGDNLRLSAAQFEFHSSYGSRRSCQRSLESWLQSGEDMLCVVDVQLALAAWVPQ